MSEDDLKIAAAAEPKIAATAEPATQQPAEQPAARRVLSGVELKRLAHNGGFTVDETTGERMIKALEEIIDTLNTRWATLQMLGQSPKLSSTSTARWVAQHTVSTASDERGLLTQLQSARAELPQYVEAIREAKRRYSDTEDGTQHRLQSFNPDHA